MGPCAAAVTLYYKRTESPILLGITSRVPTPSWRTELCGDTYVDIDRSMRPSERRENMVQVRLVGMPRYIIIFDVVIDRRYDMYVSDVSSRKCDAMGILVVCV